jgi:hypothetical protein
MGHWIKGILLYLGLTITLSMHIASGWCTMLCEVALQFGIHIQNPNLRFLNLRCPHILGSFLWFPPIAHTKYAQFFFFLVLYVWFLWSRNLVNEEVLAHWGLLCQKKKSVIFVAFKMYKFGSYTFLSLNFGFFFTTSAFVSLQKHHDHVQRQWSDIRINCKLLQHFSLISPVFSMFVWG